VAKRRCRARAATLHDAIRQTRFGHFSLLRKTMETPLEITFHNLPSSPAIEADIEKRVAKLEKLYGNLISCRVSVESPHNQHRTGNTYEVHIEMHLPG